MPISGDAVRHFLVARNGSAGLVALRPTGSYNLSRHLRALVLPAEYPGHRAPMNAHWEVKPGRVLPFKC